MKNDVARDSVNTFGTNLISAVMALLTSFFLTRYLLPSEKGIIVSIQLIASAIVTLVSFSFNSAVLYYVAKYDKTRIQKTIVKLSVYILLLIFVFGVALSLMSLVPGIKNTQFFKDTPFRFILLAVPYALLSFGSSILLSILRAENRFRSYNLIMLLQRMLVFSFSIAVLLIRGMAAVYFMVVAYLIVSVIVSATSVITIKNSKYNSDSEDITAVTERDMMKYSLKTYPSTLLSFGNNQASSLILKGFLGNGSLGVFSIAYTLTETIWLLPTSVSMVIMTRLAAMTDDGDRVRLTVISCKIVMYLCVLLSALMAVGAYYLIPVLFPNYTDAVLPLFIMLCGSIFICYSSVLSNSIAAYGRPELNIISTACGVGANILLGFVFIPLYGLMGAAIATAISFSLQGIVSVIIFHIFTKARISEMLLPGKREINAVKSLLTKKKTM
ncbi:MAG: hypothetical protein BGN88_07950 [Clostridiales bacterium 43-6]|nr:MAG: hypothetical protein BGN88_07950 [Clostridiales bacterium 43-6]